MKLIDSVDSVEFNVKILDNYIKNCSKYIDRIGDNDKLIIILIY